MTDKTDFHPLPSAFDLMDFFKTEHLLGVDYKDDALRTKVVEVIAQFNGFGFDDQPGGRRASYGDLIMHGEREQTRAGNLTKTLAASSCGLVIRVLWKLLGVDDPRLEPNYQQGSVIPDLLAIAKGFSALHKGEADFKTTFLSEDGPKRGDVIFINRTTTKKDKDGNDVKVFLQHIFTVIERDGNTFFSQDGGQSVPKALKATIKLDDGTCNGIYKRKRVIDPNTLIFSPDDEQRPVAAWIDVTKLEFTKPLIVPIRGVDTGIPDPDPA